MSKSNLQKFQDLLNAMSDSERREAIDIFNSTLKAKRSSAVQDAKNKFSVGDIIGLKGNHGKYEILEMRRTKASVIGVDSGMRYSCHLSMIEAL